MTKEAEALKAKIESGEIRTREQCAYGYATVIRSSHGSDDFDVADLNKAIWTRWSESGLVYIKRKAWKQIEGEACKCEAC